MKDIKCVITQKYGSKDYKPVKNGIFRRDGDYVVTLSFHQEPDLGEGKHSADISQYPLEDILDQFSVFISDFYKAENGKKADICLLEFCSPELAHIEGLLGIVGKHIYNREDNNSIELIIEDA